jgi:hypothetical protein
MGKVEQITIRNKIMQAVKINGTKIRVGQTVFLKTGNNTRGMIGPFTLDAILLQPEPTECHFRLADQKNKESTFVVGYSKLDM